PSAERHAGDVVQEHTGWNGRVDFRKRGCSDGGEAGAAQRSGLLSLGARASRPLSHFALLRNAGGTPALPGDYVFFRAYNVDGLICNSRAAFRTLPSAAATEAVT